MKNSISIIVIILVFLVNISWAEKVGDEKLEKEKKIHVREELEKDWFNKGYEAYNAEDYDDAIKWFKKVITLSPNFTKAHYNLGLTYHKKGVLDEAIAEYKEALAIHPDYAQAHHNLGSIYLGKGNKSLAADHLYKAGVLFLKEGLEDKAFNTYEVLKQTKSRKLELDLFNKLQNKEAVEVDDWMTKGNKAFENKNYDDAIKWFKKVITVNPNLAKAHYNLGLTYGRKEMLDEAISAYKEALSIKPNYAEANNNLGLIYENKGMLEEALSEYKKAVTIGPDLPPANYNLGRSYFNKGLNSLAAEHLHKAGLLFLKQGNKKWAVRSYKYLKQTKFKKLEKDLYDKLSLFNNKGIIIK